MTARAAGALLKMRWEETIAGLSLLVVVGSVGFGILSRHILTEAATWTVELATLSFTWTVFFGAAAAFRRGLHVQIDLLMKYFPIRVQTVAAVVVDLLILGFLIYTLYFAVLLSISSIARPSPILRIPFTFVYGAVAVSLASMLVHQGVSLLRRLRAKSSA